MAYIAENLFLARNITRLLAPSLLSGICRLFRYIITTDR
jgi:hypothetical protein